LQSSDDEIKMSESWPTLVTGLEVNTKVEEGYETANEEMSSSAALSSCPVTPPSSRSVTPLSRPVTPPLQIATSSKRMLTPEGSPPDHEKKKPKLKTVSSAIRNAFEMSQEAEDLGQEPKFGLLKFFSKGTVEDKKAYFEREDERAKNARSLNNFEEQNVMMEKKLHERELARHRQQRRRKSLKEQEIKARVRSPGGTKRKVCTIKNVVDQ
jgi:hypothetical protein